MRRYNSNSRSGDRRGGNRFNSSSFGEKNMYPAVCSNCGNSCEVPFKPTGDRPVFCSNCFEMQEKGRGSDRPSRRSFDRPSFREKRMFSAICDNCGNECQVPFKPTGEKPVYCDNCFGRDGGTSANSNRGNNGTGVSKEDLDTINTKLDKLMTFLGVE